MRALRLPSLLIFTVICFLASRPALYATAGDTTFTFNLDGTYVTSAGAYKPDGTLVRTLWRKVSYGPGSITRTWDNRDDSGNLVPGGNYQIKVLYHNTQYVFDGMIGNTSSPSSGTSVFYGPQGMHNLAITGNSAFFANGINEGRQTMHYFSTTNMGQQIDIGHKDSFIGFDQVAADDNIVYFAGRNSGFIADWPPLNEPAGDGYHTFVVAFSTTFNPVSGVFDAIPFPSPAGVNLNTNRPPGDTNPNDQDTYWAGVIDVDQDFWPFALGANHKAPTGIAVQRAGQGNGNVLAVAHGGLNVVRLFDKTSGALLRTISVSNPQGLAMSPDGSLWVISGATVRNYYGPYLTQQGGKGNPTPGPVASDDLELPVAIAVSPASLLIVADSGTHQQIKFFTSGGIAIPGWTYGQRGGYSTNGPDIALNKFGFQVGRGNNAINHTPLALQADGSLWIGDGAIRSLRRTFGYFNGTFTPTGTIMYFGEDGTSTVDAHDPKRVIGDGFLEFEVDYNAPIRQSWTLKKNWAAGLPASYFGGYSGLRSMITFRAGQSYGQLEIAGNGRTYALLSDNFGQGHTEEIVELPASGPLRRTGIQVLQRDRYSGHDTKEDCSWESDGSLRYHVVAGNTVAFQQAHLAGFGDNGDPAWDAVDEQTLATAPATNNDPIIGPNYFVPPRHPKTSTDVLVAFDAGPQGNCLPYQQAPQCIVEHDGWHLGGLKVAQPPNQTLQWLWEVSPTISDLQGADLDGLGSFLVEHDPNPPHNVRPYAGTVVVAAGRNIVYHYHEEFYHNSGNASQWMHFYDDGLFVGQFGTPYDPTHEVSGAGAVPGSTALTFFPTMVMVDSNNNEAAPGTGETYIWGNTLSSHSGVIRWHIVGANQIQEAIGTVALGGTGNLTSPTPTFPTGLTAVPGNGQVSLSWVGPPSPWSAYTLKVSTTSFGPPVQTSSGSSGTNHTFTGLTNDSSSSPLAPYYFRIAGGTMSVSNEVIAYPFDHLGRCGQLVGGPAYPWQVSSAGPSSNSPSLSGISSVVGNLARTSVGSKGFAIYGWQIKGGNRVDVINMSPGFDITLGPTGWTTWGSAHFRFDIDGKQGSDGAIHADPSGDVNIVVPPGDSSVHYLTVFCPALNDPDLENHIFEVKLTSQAVPTTPPAIYSNNGLGKYNRIYQFEFIGNVRLTISRPNSAPRIGLQAIFLD